MIGMIATEKKQERRRARRRPILDTFSVFISIPKKGGYRLPVYDISEIGMGFDYDIEGETLSSSPVSVGEVIDLCFYLNQSLAIPISVEVIRITEHGCVRRIGAQIINTESQGYGAFLSFLQTLDRLVDIAEIRPAAPSANISP